MKSHNFFIFKASTILGISEMEIKYGNRNVNVIVFQLTPWSTYSQITFLFQNVKLGSLWGLWNKGYIPYIGTNYFHSLVSRFLEFSMSNTNHAFSKRFSLFLVKWLPIGGSRISRWGGGNLRGVYQSIQSIIWQIFAKFCMRMKKKIKPGKRVPSTPPQSTNTQIIFIRRYLDL